MKLQFVAEIDKPYAKDGKWRLSRYNRLIKTCDRCIAFIIIGYFFRLNILVKNVTQLQLVKKAHFWFKSYIEVKSHLRNPGNAELSSYPNVSLLLSYQRQT